MRSPCWLDGGADTAFFTQLTVSIWNILSVFLSSLPLRDDFFFQLFRFSSPTIEPLNLKSNKQKTWRENRLMRLLIIDLADADDPASR
jgi:hypothetical protein